MSVKDYNELLKLIFIKNSYLLCGQEKFHLVYWIFVLSIGNFCVDKNEIS